MHGDRFLSHSCTAPSERSLPWGWSSEFEGKVSSLVIASLLAVLYKTMDNQYRRERPKTFLLIKRNGFLHEYSFVLLFCWLCSRCFALFLQTSLHSFLVFRYSPCYCFHYPSNKSFVSTLQKPWQTLDLHRQNTGLNIFEELEAKIYLFCYHKNSTKSYALTTNLWNMCLILKQTVEHISLWNSIPKHAQILVKNIKISFYMLNSRHN